ncbi:soluble NSF attachment protein [Catenaria anguillulae PL171]|uniref:Soluble NSF attachment protein n=1 Tax=Catenaria anguillulae PL171 TaxID=765915 RepID=A0A1Y2I3F3_9FUNG|nr:soluble NSF attachment protein [Catenaria anguillulae PL171]
MSAAIAEAEALIEKAEKRLNAGVLSSLFGGNKYEEAEELYTKAANQFKLGKKWKEAGDAFMQAADMQMRLNERDEAASRFVDASNAYKKVSPQDAIKALQQAIQILTERGRFQMAAKHQKTIAEIYESDLVDLEKAMEAYELAAEWFQGEEASALANGCLLKVATFAAQLEKYTKAIELFEKIGAASMDNNLTKWSVKEYFQKAGLCYLAAEDHVGARQAVERYCDLDVTFATTRECKFVQDLLDALEASDADTFTAHVVEYDKLTKLDPWKTSVLLKIKKGIESTSFA